MYNGTARNHIARLDIDGSLDVGFNPGTGVNGTVETIAIQSDGKIIVGGLFYSVNGTAINHIARLNTNGSLDAGFNPGAGASSTIYTTAIQSDGKIIIGGAFTIYNGIARDHIARLDIDGSLDAGFNPNTGAITIYTTAIQSDGKVIIGGYVKIARFNTNGSVDAGFTPGTGANNINYTTAIQSDGKIVIGGSFTSYNGTARSKITRLNTNGTLDAGFTPGAGANNTIRTIAIQNDGKIIIAGLFTSYDGTLINRIARLNSDGSLDASFNTGSGANNTIFSAAIQSDGKIIIGGLFTSYNGVAKTRIARLIANATAGTSSFDYFRTITSGNWNTTATWESSPVADFTSGVISPATIAPDVNAKAITIRGTHIVTVTANVMAHQLSVDPGGNLIVISGVIFTIK